MPLTPADLSLHQALGITATMLDQMQVRRVDDVEARELLAQRSRPGKLDGILYPYIDPREQRIVTYRLRRDFPDMEAGKPKNKYLSTYGDHRHLYVAADAPLLQDAAVPIIAVEAEKSVLAVQCAAERCCRTVLAIGLGGCYSWRGRIGKVDTANGGRADEYGPIADLNHLAWKERDVIIAFDSNARTNRTVQTARRTFAQELASRGAHIRILDLPSEFGNGPDDYIGRRGADQFFALVDAAKDALTFDVIFRLNRTHAVVREAGRTVVINEEYDPILQRRIFTRSSVADFRQFYLNESIKAGVKKNGEPGHLPLGHFWLMHPDRRQYQGIVMNPGRDVPGYLNLWRGFAVDPNPGNWSLFKQHLFEVICRSNTTTYDYVLAWMADGVQHPDRMAEVALVLRGPRGSGKGIFARTYGELFGQHYLHIANTKHLTGNFNAHLQDAVVLFADEAFWAGDKAGESVLKMLVTEPVIAIERKGRDVVAAKNLLHVIIASNHDWVVPAGTDERRFCVLDLDPAYQQDHAYFRAILQQLDGGGRAALLYDLLHHDLSVVNLRQVPDTEALREQKLFSLPPNERWLLDKLMTGRWLSDHEDWQTTVPKDALHDDYIQTLQKIGIDRRSTQTELGMLLKKILGHALQASRRLVHGKRQTCWKVDDLQACRTAFDAAMRTKHPWQTDADED